MIDVIVTLAVACVIAFIAYEKRLLDAVGIITAAILGILVLLLIGVGAFILLIAFFILGNAATMYKSDLKMMLGIQQAMRGYQNVLGNGASALIMAFLSKFDPSFTVGFVGAIASATSDTLATEIGEGSRRNPVLITTFEEVPTGTSGGITPLGEISALLGSILMACLAIILVPSSSFLPVAIGSFAATHFDSLLGATLERAGILNNHLVNFFATLFGALLSTWLYISLG